MKKLIAMLGAVVTAVTSAWAANVGDTVTWSNLDSTADRGSHFSKGNNDCTLNLAATEDCKAGTTITLTEVRFASPAGKTWADTITINGVTSATKSEIDSGIETYDKFEVYSFTTPVDVYVGSDYSIGTSGGIQLSAVQPTEDYPNPISIPGLTGKWVGYMAYCSVSGTIKEFPARDPINFVWSIAEGSETAAWTPSQPENLIVTDTISIKAPDAVLNGEIPCAVTITADGSLTVNGPTDEEADSITVNAANAGTLKTTGKVALTGSSSGTLEVVSGTTTLNYAHNSLALSGNVTIDADATMIVTQTDTLNYNGSATVKVYGTLDLGAKRWSMGANNKLFVYGTGLVKGAGEAAGALEYFSNGNRLVISGGGEISAKIGIRTSGHALNLAQTRDSTFKFTGPFVGAGNLVKTFATVDEGNTQANSGNSFARFSGDLSSLTGSLTHKNSCGTLVLLPAVTFSSTTSITSEGGTGLQFGENNEAGRGEIVIHGNVTHSGNQIANYSRTTIEGTLTSNNGISINANSKLTISDATTITATGSGKFGGAGKIICPANGNAPTYVADTDWTGTVEVLARSYSSGTNRIPLNDYGTANSKIIVKGVAISGSATTWISGGAAVTAELQVDGAMTFNNGSSNQTYVYNKITGTGDIALLAWDNNVKNNVKQTVKVMENYTGTFNSDFTTTKIEKVVLAETPTEEVKVLALAEGSTAVVLAVYVGEDDITTGDEAVCTLTQKEDGWYVAPKGSSDLPGEALIDDEEKDAYRTWAADNGVTAETTTDPSVLAIAFHLGAAKGDTYDTIEEAAQAKVEELLKDIDLSALAAEREDAALTALNTALADKGLVASLAPVTLEGTSESTKLYKLVIKLIKENTEE